MPLREPLKWTGGIRESASGLIVELHTDEGLVGIGEAPGPTLPAIQTIIEREFTQFLVGDAEHDGTAIRVRDDESLVLELLQRLAHRAAARLQLARDLVLDQALSVLEPTGDDRLAQGLDDLLAAAALGCRLLRHC